MSESPGADELYFLPLGGTGEIGMNLNLYGHDGQWLMVDLGVTFAGPRQDAPAQSAHAAARVLDHELVTDANAHADRSPSWSMTLSLPSSWRMLTSAFPKRVATDSPSQALNAP